MTRKRHEWTRRAWLKEVSAAGAGSVLAGAAWTREGVSAQAPPSPLPVQPDGAIIVKFYLHISKDEQKARLEERLADPSKHWKFEPVDLKMRERWDDFREAYEDALSRCSTNDAPWYVVPANRKWVRNLAIAEILVETLEGMNPRYPKVEWDPSKIKIPD